MQARAAVYLGAGQPLAVRDFEVAPPAPREARLGLGCSGICGTDIHILEGRLALAGPLILGHEFIGRVEALGAEAATDGLGQRLATGDAAIACVAVACGRCASCRRGEAASCLNFGVTYFRDPAEAPHFFGGYAECLYSTAGQLVRVPDGLPLDAVAAYACAGPTIIRACAYGGGLAADELVVVQGTGPVGLFAIAWAAVAGCQVVAIGSGSSPERLRLAKQFGARLVLDYRAGTPEERAEQVRTLATELDRGDGADVVVEASGAPGAVPEGLALLRTRGRYLIPGQYSSSGAVALQPEQITFRALRLIGSGQYTLADLGAYLEFLAAHAPLQTAFAASITHRFTVDQAREAVEAVAAGQTGKAIFVRE